MSEELNVSSSLFISEGDPDNFLTYFKRATVFLAMGRSKAALPDLDRVLELRPDFFQVCLQNNYIIMGKDFSLSRHSEENCLNFLDLAEWILIREAARRIFSPSLNFFNVPPKRAFLNCFVLNGFVRNVTIEQTIWTTNMFTSALYLYFAAKFLLWKKTSVAYILETGHFPIIKFCK